MSNNIEDKKAEEKQGRVNVSSLPREAAELNDKEARDVKGGGGLTGGVVGSRKAIGEEIPS